MEEVTSHFQSDLVVDLLERNKPPPPGPPKDYNLPLLLALLFLLVGLLLSGLSLYDETKTSFLLKCLAPFLVFTGTFAVLLRILFCYFPSALVVNNCGQNYKSK